MACPSPAVKTGPVALDFPAGRILRINGSLLSRRARGWRAGGFRVVGFGPSAIFVHGAERFSFVDAAGVGFAVGPVAEINLAEVECSEAGCVVDLQYTFLER